MVDEQGEERSKKGKPIDEDDPDGKDKEFM